MNSIDSKTSRILLDTSFLLPTLGFETAAEIINTVSKLSRFTVYYSDLSILEAMWKIVKLIKRGSEKERVEQGLRAIRATFHLLSPDVEAISMAIDMYMKGHKDLIDNLLYSMAAKNKILFLTVDKELIDFISMNAYPTQYIITPNQVP